MTDLLNKQELPADLTQEEVNLLDPKFLYDHNPYHQMKNPRNFTDTNMYNVWKHHAYPLVLIRKAYFKLRKEETDILQVLRDSLSRHTLFHLVGSLRSIMDYTVRLAEIRDSLLPLQVAEDLSKQSMGGTKLGKGRRKFYPRPVPKISEGTENLSKNINHIFLILNEILSTLPQSHKRFDVPELMGLAMVGIKRLKREFIHECFVFEKLIGEGIASDEERKKLNKELFRELDNNDDCLGAGGKFFFPDIVKSIGSFMYLVDMSDIS